MDQSVIIVSGLPRSGTSMMMRMLEAGGIPVLVDNLRQADEDNPNGYYEFELVKKVREDATWLTDARGKAVKMVYRLLYDLPGDGSYRVIFMTRNLGEVIASQNAMLQRNGKGSDDLTGEQLAEIYSKQLREARAWLDSRPNFEVLYVDYGDALNETGRVADELNQFLHGQLNTNAMVEVPNPSLYRQRR
jgi:Sulfotransferase domain